MSHLHVFLHPAFVSLLGISTRCAQDGAALVCTLEIIWVGEVSERRIFGCGWHSQGWKQGCWDMEHHARWAQENMQVPHS